MRWAYCHTCHKNVNPKGERCPNCDKVLWEMIALVPDKDSKPLKTTKEMYRIMIKHGMREGSEHE